MSAWTSLVSARITVRHTPFTARLSPGDSSLASVVPMRSRTPPLVGLRSINSPTVSTSPVNIAFNQHIGTQRHDATLDEIGRRKRSIRQEGHAVGSERTRRDVEPHVI